MTLEKPQSRWRSVLILLVVLILLSPAAKLANSSIVAGTLLTAVFSALYFLFARSSSPKGTRIFRAGGIIGLLLISLICAIPGLVLIHYSGYLNKSLLGYGILTTFGGMIVGAIIFTVVANRFVKGEKQHWQQDLAKKRSRTPLLHRKIKARASVVRMKAHPFLVILFCLVSWIVGIAMVVGGLSKNGSAGLILIGAFISFGYTCALGLIFFVILRGKWNSYFDSAIEKVDLEIKRLEEKSASLGEPK